MTLKHQDLLENDPDIRRWRAAFQQLILSFGSGLRHTQDNPVLSDVWMFYANYPNQPAPLIIVPDYKTQSGELVAYLLDRTGEAPDENRANAADTDGLVRQRLWANAEERTQSDDLNLFALSNDVSANVKLDVLIKHFVPKTNWWLKEADVEKRLPTILREAKNSLQLGNDDFREAIVDAFRSSREKEIWRFLAIVGLLDYANETVSQYVGNFDAQAYRTRWNILGTVSEALLNINDGRNTELSSDLKDYIEHALTSVGAKWLEFWQSGHHRWGVTEGVSLDGIAQSDLEREDNRHISIWKINLNRDFNLSLNESRRTIKADAAERVFEHSTNGIVWAVIDSGVDATHPCFRRRYLENALPDDTYSMKRGAEFTDAMVVNRVSNSRVLATYDFNRLDLFLKGQFAQLLDGRSTDSARNNAFVRRCISHHQEPEGRAITAYLIARHAYPDRLRLLLKTTKENESDFVQFGEEVDRLYVQITRQLNDIERYILAGREINWILIEPIIIVPHTHEYHVPENPHGTHVASTLCGDIKRGELTPQEKREEDGFDAEVDGYPAQDVIGVCPNLEIYDLRVCSENGGGKEFIVLAALQFIHHLNRDRGKMRVQGTNISLSLPHDLRNFACGRTPVCLESERLISNGVVVVAAAGNAGVSNRITASGSSEGYDAISITDPGNAEGVITVGATHKREPHTYGISYFSSKGPTGDGRMKPDIVAPGEKILAAVPKSKVDIMDGTSMAAPHVSGAAASLMARHRELIRQPDRVKQILCNTATDLRRERRFQGAGLVDILRAIQSV